MKKTILFVSLLLSSVQTNAFAETVSKMKGHLLKVEFSYSNDKKNFKTQSELIIPESNLDWIPLSQGKDGVALIGKLHKVELGVFSVEFMVINTTTTPVSIFRMAAGTLLGKTVEAKTGDATQKINVSISATPTEFTPGKSLK